MKRTRATVGHGLEEQGAEERGLARQARTPSPWRPGARIGARGLLTVLAALECEVTGLPEWVLTTSDDDYRAGSAGSAAAPHAIASRIGR